jgi:hypothetical protein
MPYQNPNRWKRRLVSFSSEEDTRVEEDEDVQVETSHTESLILECVLDSNTGNSGGSERPIEVNGAWALDFSDAGDDDADDDDSEDIRAYDIDKDRR